jgi:adenylate cyclase
MQDQLGLLNRISDELNSDLDLDNMLQRVLNLTVSHLGAAEGSILLFDEQQTVTDHILMRQDLTEAGEDRVVGRVLAEGFVGWVVAHKQGDIIHDTHEDARWISLDHVSRSALRSSIGHGLPAAPTRSSVRRADTGSPRAQFLPKRTPLAASEHLSLLMAIADQSAIALENAQLFKQTEGERARLWAILDSTQDAVVATNPSDRLLLLNPAAKDAFDIERDDWANQPRSTIRLWWIYGLPPRLW